MVERMYQNVERKRAETIQIIPDIVGNRKETKFGTILHQFYDELSDDEAQKEKHKRSELQQIFLIE